MSGLPTILLVIAIGVILRQRQTLAGYDALKKEHEQQEINSLILEEKHEVEGNRVRDVFLAHISHELRTPLNVITGYSELVEEICLDDAQEHLITDIRKIQKAARHLQTIVNEMLELSKIEAGKLELQYETCPSDHLLNGLKKSVSQTLSHKSNRLEMFNLLSWNDIEVDVVKIRQMLTNLVLFAHRICENSEISLRLDHDTDKGHPLLLFLIRFPSPGLEPGALDALLRGETSIEQATDDVSYEGGLGLAISKSLCVVMGGYLDGRIDSEGVLLIARIPATHASAKNQPLEPAIVQGEAALIVTDDLGNGSKLVNGLASKGMDAQLAANEEEALWMARDKCPAIIIIDGMMPQMNGWKTLDAIKSEPATKGTPVIMTSMMDEVSKTYALGAIGFLNKPVAERRLIGILDRYVTREEGRRVLLVEDDRVSRRIVRKILEKAGWLVDEAENGHVALERLLKGNLPTLILLDLMMPEMGGYDLFGELRKTDIWRKIPVIFISSAHVTEQSKLRIPGLFTHITNQGDFGEPKFQQLITDQVALFLKQDSLSGSLK